MADKLDDTSLLSMLQGLEDNSAQYVHGELAEERTAALNEYNREPYGNEEEGWSSVVTSDIQDTVEAILPDLLDVFASTDKAVVFDPVRAEDVKGAEQATDTGNYVFYKQNNGFLTLYTAIKDALQVKSCAVMWRKVSERSKSVTPVRGATQDMLAMFLAESGGDLDSVTPRPPQPMIDAATGQPAIDPMTGQPMMGPELFDARISVVEERKRIKVEAFDPGNLLVYRDWTSPLLAECPYVCRLMEVTLSDIHEMGHKDVTAEDLGASDDAGLSTAGWLRRKSRMPEDAPEAELNDESLTKGYLRIEFVLADFDGDGIAERRMIVRLQDKILSNDEVSHVQIATASPLLVTHHWVGQGLWDLLSDIQKLRSELWRQTLNSAYLANSPRYAVLEDEQGTPYANIDDLLDHRPGGIYRQKRENAVVPSLTPFVGHQMLPLLEQIDQMRESRTGVSMSAQGLDPNAINDRTATAARLANGAAQKRIKLMARIFAEILLKPVFQGILKLLTDGDMEKIAFRLRDEFVEYDPNEWRDSYDMTVNVGLGTGDRDQQTAALQMIAANQGALAMSPFGQLLITPKTIYNTNAKLVENAGFKNVGDFYMDPGDQQLPPPPPPPPDPQVIITQMKLAAEQQKFQAETQRAREADERKAGVTLAQHQGTLELQAANDQRDAQREALTAHYEAQEAARKDETDRYKADLQALVQQTIADEKNRTALLLEQMKAQHTAELDELRAGHAAQLADQQAQQQPKQEPPQ